MYISDLEDLLKELRTEEENDDCILNKIDITDEDNLESMFVCCWNIRLKNV